MLTGHFKSPNDYSVTRAVVEDTLTRHVLSLIQIVSHKRWIYNVDSW